MDDLIRKGFLAEGIPYRVVGGVGFYARTEIKAGVMTAGQFTSFDLPAYYAWQKFEPGLTKALANLRAAQEASGATVTL